MLCWGRRREIVPNTPAKMASKKELEPPRESPKDMELIGNISADLLKLKADRVIKSLQAEEQLAAIKALTTKAKPFLVVLPGAQGTVTASNSLPTKVTGHWILFYLNGPPTELPTSLVSIVLDTNPCTNLLFYYDLVSLVMEAFLQTCHNSIQNAFIFLGAWTNYLLLINYAL